MSGGLGFRGTPRDTSAVESSEKDNVKLTGNGDCIRPCPKRANT